MQSLKFDKELETFRRSNDTGTTFFSEWLGVDFSQGSTGDPHYYSVLFKLPNPTNINEQEIDLTFFRSPTADFSLAGLIHSKSYSSILDEFKDKIVYPSRVRAVGYRTGYGGNSCHVSIQGFLTMPFSSSPSSVSTKHVDYRFWVNGSGPSVEETGYFSLTSLWFSFSEAINLTPTLYSTMTPFDLWQFLNSHYVAPLATGPPWYETTDNLSGRLFDSVDYGSMLDQNVYVDDVSSGSFDSIVELGNHSTIGGQRYRCVLSVGWPMQV